MKDLSPEIINAINLYAIEVDNPGIPDMEKEYIEHIHAIWDFEDNAIYRKLTFGTPPEEKTEADSEEKQESKTVRILNDVKDKVQHISQMLIHRIDGTQFPRVVVIGDIHCDYNSLKALLMKLHYSDYDYFNKAYFVFLGDYLDRGAAAFEVLRLLLYLKNTLKERCILLRGNHDVFLYNNEKKEYYSPVYPAETVGFFSNYLQAETIEIVKQFYDSLPYFALLDYPEHEKNYLLVHGGIPYDKCLKDFKVPDFDGITLPLESKTDEQKKRSLFLNSMLWGDPRDVDMKMNGGSSRFEFGRKQFEEFTDHFGVSHLIRGHEPTSNGYEYFYDKKLCTIFSTGGTGNDQTYYDGSVKNPAFGIISEKGKLHIEPVFAYRIDFNYIKSKEGTKNYSKEIRNEDLQPYNFVLTHDHSLEVVSEGSEIDSPLTLSKEFAIKLSLSEIPTEFQDRIPILFDTILKSVTDAKTTSNK